MLNYRSKIGGQKKKKGIESKNSGTLFLNIRRVHHSLYRRRREEYLPIFKRRLLGGLLDFSARELQAQLFSLFSAAGDAFIMTQVVAAAAAGVAAEGLSPMEAKAQVENAAQLSVFLVENAIVILMLVEDHLRIQSKLSCASRKADGVVSPLSLISPLYTYSKYTASNGRESPEALDDCSSGNSGGLPIDVHTLSP
ncbi:hypothetical protein V6N13_004251 [Hibiscus sabdariffa]